MVDESSILRSQIAKSRLPIAAISVLYTDEMVANAESYSPSAAKPRQVVESWRGLGLPLNIVAPAPVTREDLYRAHDRRFVDAVLDCQLDNGFGNRLPEVAKSLPYTSGSMLAAAREAIRNGRVAVAPCSGFHHAGYARSAGFCTFNGLMVTAMALKASGEANRVGILDFDQHEGDGTDNIIRRLNIDWITHFTAGKHYHFTAQAPGFLDAIPQIVAGMTDCDVILYQAGADPHVDDPLGGWLTAEQLSIRDELVFATAAELGVPLAWNLAGGYQVPLRRVLKVHNNTLRACAKAHL